MTDLDLCRQNIQNTVEELNNILGDQVLTTTSGNRTIFGMIEDYKVTNNCYTKDEVYSEAEVLAKIANLQTQINIKKGQ